MEEKIVVLDPGVEKKEVAEAARCCKTTVSPFRPEPDEE